jgi:hypothetical protein
MGYRAMKRRAITIANHSSQEIVLRVYQHMINKHQEFCDCNYCTLLKEYVTRKKRLSRFNHMYEYDTSIAYECYLKEKDTIRQLKIRKDALKKLKL